MWDKIADLIVKYQSVFFGYFIQDKSTEEIYSIWTVTV